MNSNRRDFLRAARFMGAGLFISSGLTCSVSKGRGIPENEETSPVDLLGQEYNLAGERKHEPQKFYIETKIVYFDEEGKREAPNIFRLSLNYEPGETTGSGKYICNNFSLQKGEEEEVNIPGLENWNYDFIFGVDSRGYVFGIDHNEFLNLFDSKGNLLDSEDSYWTYNTFIDFHSFCDVFGSKPPFDLEGGIQDLRYIGDSIEHLSSQQEAPVDLGDLALPGSVFQNGRIILHFKGLSLYNNHPCAIVKFDAGESSFVMMDKPRSGKQRTSIGSSHYFGDIYINLDSYWVNNVEMNEFVTGQRTIEGQAPERFVAERNSYIIQEKIL